MQDSLYSNRPPSPEGRLSAPDDGATDDSSPPLVFVVDDSVDDIDLIRHGLLRAGFACRIVAALDSEQFQAHLAEAVPEVILADYYMHRFGAKQVLEILAERKLDIPVIVVSGAVGDEPAVECMKLGAVDYLLKDRLGRLPRAIEHAIHGRVLMRQQQEAVAETKRLAERLTTTLESITDAFLTVDREWRVTYVNREAERVLCRARADLLGKSLWAGFPEAKGSLFQQQYERAMHENVPVQFEEFYAPLNLWAEVRVYPSSQGLAIYFRDAGQTRKAALALRESEERYRLLFHANPHPVWLHDAETLRIIDVNETALQHYGYSRSEFLSMTLDDLIAPGDTAMTRPGLPATGAIGFRRRRHRLKDGRVILVELTSHDILSEFQAARLTLAQDITEKTAAEAALRESERRFRELAENVEEVFYNYDPRENRKLYVSPAFERVWGQSCARLYQEPMAYLESIHPDDRPTAEDALKRCLNGQSAEVEYRIVRPDGEIRWVRDSSYPILDLHGAIERVVGTARDVTDQHHATEILRESEERFRLLVDGVRDYAILLLDPAGSVASWNVGAERIHGYMTGEILGQPFSRFFSSEDVEAGLPERCLHDAAREGRCQMELRLARKDGSLFWASILLTALRNESGQLRGFSKITHDISERRHTGERLAEQAALLDHASDAIIVRDMRGAIRFWNQGAQRLYGWTSDEATGQTADRLIYSDGESTESIMQTVLERGEWTGEVAQRTKSDQTVIVHGRWTLLRDACGEPRSVLVINSDITDRKRVEAQFLRAQRMESIGTLAGGIAHDLNNLLAPITMGVGLLKQTARDAEIERVIDIVERSAERGRNLVRQILSFARGVEGAHVTLNVRHLLNEVTSVISETFPKNIVVDVRIEGDPWLLSGDPTQLNQVLLNLCLNARDAMPKGGRLAITAGNVQIDEQFAAAVPRAAAGPYIRIAVTDTGVGIPRQLLDRIFDPFFTTKDIGKGTGLGLATALGITQAHGGFLTVQSESGIGSTFTVHLRAQPQGADAPLSMGPVVGEPPRGAGELILVVDDEAFIRDITKQTLEKFGYHVLLAEDGADAITRFIQNQSRVALVVTDLVMPVMDGLALVAALRRIAPLVRIIGASGASGEGDVVRFSNASVAHVIAKPFSAYTLLCAVREALKQP